MIGLHQRESHSCSRGITASPYSLERGRRWTRTSSGRSQPAVSKNTAPSFFCDSCIGASRWSRSDSYCSAGVDDPVGLDERLGGAQPGVLAARLVRVEPGDVAVADVDLGVAVGHPLGDRAADAGALLDPDRGGRPEALDLGLSPRIGAPSQVSESRPLIA